VPNGRGAPPERASEGLSHYPGEGELADLNPDPALAENVTPAQQAEVLEWLPRSFSSPTAPQVTTENPAFVIGRNADVEPYDTKPNYWTMGKYLDSKGLGWEEGKVPLNDTVIARVAEHNMPVKLASPTGNLGNGTVAVLELYELEQYGYVPFRTIDDGTWLMPSQILIS
jgi:hypothetical protein